MQYPCNKHCKTPATHTATHCNTLQHSATHWRPALPLLLSHASILSLTHTHTYTYIHTQSHVPHTHTRTHTHTLGGYWYHVTCHTATHCNALTICVALSQLLILRRMWYCNKLQPTATHCNTLQFTATHCNALQRTATHCNALQRTATHCTTLQHTDITSSIREWCHVSMGRW